MEKLHDSGEWFRRSGIFTGLLAMVKDPLVETRPFVKCNLRTSDHQRASLRV